ncbi:hypothetical protein GN958_ATG04973 [Phytophthora infestans]|uniref:Uncharacterized protein n=1 Tax=Phytophthora infestans TaxID=4787 RepID=A0A8S9TFX3_PHYIN|nr:hypothetical protein GN958_ATG23691 [Phytophthora infestans]KAF4145833.1 hypothetical protein GN958_ATG04973 [Phytophthora infestans]
MKISVVFPDLFLLLSWIHPRDAAEIPIAEYLDEFLERATTVALQGAEPWKDLSGWDQVISFHIDVCVGGGVVWVS